MFGQQAKINAEVIDALNLGTDDRVLDVGCGTGVVTRAIADRLLKMGNGIVTGIDAAGKMIWGAREKRGTDNCRFETAAAEYSAGFERNCIQGNISCFKTGRTAGSL